MAKNNYPDRRGEPTKQVSAILARFADLDRESEELTQRMADRRRTVAKQNTLEAWTLGFLICLFVVLLGGLILSL